MLVSAVIVSTLLAAGEPPPTPLAGKSQKAICEDDALLLLKYPWAELTTGGFKKVCCVKEALGEDGDRCELDWPSSDVLACSELDRLRNLLFALHGYTFKEPAWQEYFAAQPWYRARPDFTPSWLPAVGQQNVATLKALAKKKGACVPAAELGDLADEVTCVRAGVRHAADRAHQADGKLTQARQKALAGAITTLCRQETWGRVPAACLADGKGDPCLPALTEAQRAALEKAAAEALRR